MSRVTNTVLIQGEPEHIFDLVTTPKFWPRWHPATVSVKGAIDQPMRLGDMIRERAKIGGVEGEGDWKVMECDRPRRVVLHVEGTAIGAVNITYQFEAGPDEVEFTRILDFDASALPENVRPLVERQMATDSAEGLARLKAFVEHQLSG